jgi:glycosyltransferase involved in cell wall biosynthesis
LRIIHVITRFILGGADENTLYTCNGQAYNGHDVILIVGKEWDQSIRDRLDSRVRFIVLNCLVREISVGEDLKSLFRLGYIYRDIRPDIIHTHESKAGVIGRLSSLVSPKGCGVIHGVHIIPFEAVSGLRRVAFLVLEKLSAILTDRYVTVSSALEESMISNGLGSKAQHRVIPSGMDVGKYINAVPFSISELASITGLKENILTESVTIIASGTLEKRKRVDMLLRIVASLQKRMLKVVLLVGGDGVCMEEWRELSLDLGISANVAFLGYTNDLDRFIASSDVCCHAAEHEGLPRVVIQYLAAGKPVLVSNLPGIDTVVKDGVNGFIIPEGDWDEYENRLINLISNVEFSHGVRDLDRGYLEPWAMQNMVRDIEEVYISCVGKGIKYELN